MRATDIFERSDIPTSHVYKIAAHLGFREPYTEEQFKEIVDFYGECQAKGVKINSLKSRSQKSKIQDEKGYGVGSQQPISSLVVDRAQREMKLFSEQVGSLVQELAEFKASVIKYLPSLVDAKTEEILGREFSWEEAQLIDSNAEVEAALESFREFRRGLESRFQQQITSLRIGASSSGQAALLPSEASGNFEATQGEQKSE